MCSISIKISWTNSILLRYMSTWQQISGVTCKYSVLEALISSGEKKIVSDLCLRWPYPSFGNIWDRALGRQKHVRLLHQCLGSTRFGVESKVTTWIAKSNAGGKSDQTIWWWFWEAKNAEYQMILRIGQELNFSWKSARASVILVPPCSTNEWTHVAFATIALFIAY